MSFRNQFFGSPLMMQPEAAASFHLELMKPQIDQSLIQSLQAKKEDQDEILTIIGNTAVICVSGAIAKGSTEFERWCYNLAELDLICDAISSVSQNALVKRVIFVFDTPGGTGVGTPEVAAQIAKLSQNKETYSYIETQCCSAGYYLASQTMGIVATKSAIVGSIGTYMVNIEYTRKLADDGVTVDIIKAGKFKAMGSPFKALTDEEKALLQSRCDALNDDFIAACQANRKIEDGALEGQWFLGADAHQKGLVDEVTDLTLDEFVALSL